MSNNAYLYEYTVGSQRIECIAESDEDCVIYRAVEWSPDGTMLAASTDDSTLRIYDVKTQVTQYASGEHGMSPLAAYTTIAHAGTLLGFAWYPHMNRDPAANCFIESVRDHPLHLCDTQTGKVRASYSAYDAYDTLMSATAVAFSHDGTSIYAGYATHIGRFDVHREGPPVELTQTTPSRRSRDGLKGIVSCLATNNTHIASATLSGQLALHTPDTQIACVWRVPVEYGGTGVTHLRWAPNNIHVWAASRQSEFIVAWDIRDLRAPCAVVRRPGRTMQRMQFAFDASGRHLAVGQADGRVVLHDLNALDCDQSNALVQDDPNSVQAHGDLVAGISSHPYYPLLATASGQRRFCDPNPAPNCLRVWSVPAQYYCA
ncbi:hypothetical protein GGF48_002544 [Coemansia sp. RSA 921]|nr:hypothetical protein GGF48_002544 [Coemansia sp. RSA 921]